VHVSGQLITAESPRLRSSWPWASVKTDVDTAVSEVYLSVITGKKPVEDLDKLLEQVKSMGIADAIDAYQAAYDRYLAR